MKSLNFKQERSLKSPWQKKYKRFEQKLMTVGFVSFLITVGIWNGIAPDQEFSELENRVLTKNPTLSLEGIFKGEYMNDYEVYLSDQFAGKIGWTTIKVKTEQWMGKHEINGVFIGKDGFLLERFSKKEDTIIHNIDYINDFSNKDNKRNVFLMLVPTSIELYQDKLPPFANISSQKVILDKVDKLLLDNVELINGTFSLTKHKKEEIYFKTDHHWTMRGAYYGYVKVAEVLGLEPFPLADFTTENVSTNFFGTYASKVIGLPVQPDVIEVFQPDFPVDYKVTYVDTGEVTDTLYNWDSLQKRDQYSLFLQGNHSLLTIQSHVKNGRKLAIIKDSYAHVMVPFLANHYEEIHVIDLRYYHSGLNDYLEENDLNEILFLYNIPNFIDDSNLIWLKS